MCDVLKGFDSSHVPDNVQNLFTSMHNMYRQSKTSPAEYVLSSQIRKLHAKQMMGIYVRSANCGMLLLTPDDTSQITIATFQPNLTNEQIYGSDDNVYGDIQVNLTNSNSMTNTCRYNVRSIQLLHCNCRSITRHEPSKWNSQIYFNPTFLLSKYVN